VEAGKLRSIAAGDSTGKLLDAFQAKLSEEKLTGRGSRPSRGGACSGHGRPGSDPKVPGVARWIRGTCSESSPLGKTWTRRQLQALRPQRRNLAVQRTLQRALRDAVIGLRLERSNLSLEQEQLEKILSPIELESFQVAAGGPGQEEGVRRGLLRDLHLRDDPLHGPSPLTVSPSCADPGGEIEPDHGGPAGLLSRTSS